MGALFDQFMNKYPYTDFHELNADWLIKTLMEMINQVENFVSLNAIKYADPIQWDIVRQYEKNTVVIDPLTGTAYISVQPVPSGVALTRTEYWTVVFDLGSFVTRAAKNFSNRYEEETTLTATFPSNVGDWIVWGDTLYRALINITAGDSYVVNSNIERITIEDIINYISSFIADINQFNNVYATSNIGRGKIFIWKNKYYQAASDIAINDALVNGVNCNQVTLNGLLRNMYINTLAVDNVNVEGVLSTDDVTSVTTLDINGADDVAIHSGKDININADDNINIIADKKILIKSDTALTGIEINSAGNVIFNNPATNFEVNSNGFVINSNNPVKYTKDPQYFHSVGWIPFTDSNNNNYKVLTSADNWDGLIHTDDIADGSITAAKLDPNLVLNDHILIFGDSFSDPAQAIIDNVDENWCDLIAHRFGATLHNYALIGRGYLVRGGAAYGTMEEQIDTAIADTSFNHSGVKMVFLFAGLNDINGYSGSDGLVAIRTALNNCIDKISAEFPNTKIIIMGSDAFHVLAVNNNNGLNVGNINQIYEAVSKDRQCIYFTMSYLWVGSNQNTFYTPTGHPSAAGHRAIASKVIKELCGGDDYLISILNDVTNWTCSNGTFTPTQCNFYIYDNHIDLDFVEGIVNGYTAGSFLIVTYTNPLHMTLLNVPDGGTLFVGDMFLNGQWEGFGYVTYIPTAASAATLYGGPKHINIR